MDRGDVPCLPHNLLFRSEQLVDTPCYGFVSAATPSHSVVTDAPVSPPNPCTPCPFRL